MIAKDERDLSKDKNVGSDKDDESDTAQEIENEYSFSKNEPGDNLSYTHSSKDAFSKIVDEEQAQISKLKVKISDLKQTSEKSQTRIRYLLADFDNYRKQAEKQTEAKIEVIRADLLDKLIKIEDDYERAIDTIGVKNCTPSIIDGLQGILRNLKSMLKSEGVLEIEALGTPFDPSVHDAVSYKPSENEPDNMVIGVVRKGFMLNNKVLRPSLVILSKKIISNKDKNQSEKE